MFTELMPAAPRAEAPAQFIALFEAALASGVFTRLVLSKHEGPEADLQRLTVRRVTIGGQPQLGFLYRHATRDVTKNHAEADGVAAVRSLLGSAFKHAHLHTRHEEVQLRFSKKGKSTLQRGKPAAQPDDTPAAPATHDREKHRLVDIARPFLAALGVTDERGRLVPAMARKWRQINKFVEVFAHAFSASPLSAKTGPVRVLDFGAGKGYLTFALHDHLRGALGRDAQVTGVELREDMVALCNAAAQRLALDGLAFERGDVRDHAAGEIDVMIALHACDTATDVALHRGIRSHAAIIMCSPCCHKELRPQMHSPAPAAADAATRHPPRPAGRDGDRQPACPSARGAWLRHAGVRVRRARAHQQEQDDPGREARGRAGVAVDRRVARGAGTEGLLRRTGAQPRDAAARRR